MHTGRAGSMTTVPCRPPLDSVSNPAVRSANTVRSVPAIRYEVVTLSCDFGGDTHGVHAFSRRQVLVGALAVLAVVLFAGKLLSHPKAAASPRIPTATSPDQA